jgi:hypothetical protein
MTTAQESSFKEDVAKCLERRRQALTETERVVAAMKDTVLSHRVCAMAIPTIYAHWEGFAKEALQLYVVFLENSAVQQGDIDRMQRHQKKLNALVVLRNTIGHGGREPEFDRADVKDRQELVVELMVDLESTLHNAVDNALYKNPIGLAR